jgi:transposase-like protein
MEPGMSVSLVTREAGITASQLFQWRKAYTEGSLVAVGANEAVVPASELTHRIRKGQFSLDTLNIQGQAAPTVGYAVLAS